jgi:hypothetical protein
LVLAHAVPDQADKAVGEVGASLLTVLIHALLKIYVEQLMTWYSFPVILVIPELSAVKV